MIISNDIKYIGVNDRKIDLFEGQYIVPNGMAYNSYAIFDDSNGTVDLRRLDFDFPAYINAFANRGLPLPAWLDHLNRLNGRLLGTKKKKLSLRRRT